MCTFNALDAPYPPNVSAPFRHQQPGGDTKAGAAVASLVDVLNPPPIGGQVHPGGAIKPSITFMALL